MSKVLKSFNLFIIQIKGDMMLEAMVVAPLLMGITVRFILPIVENELCKYFNTTAILSPYYLIFDLSLAYITPVMFSFCGVMVMLEEIDNGISNYLIVTPLGKKGYLLSRIGLPTVIAVFYDILVILIFALTDFSILMIINLSILSGLMGIIASMLIISFATNKVEGMAMSKLSGFLIIGLPVPFFINTSIQYIASVLPSFWITKLAITQNYLFTIPTIIISLLWIWILLNRFEKKLIK